MLLVRSALSCITSEKILFYEAGGQNNYKSKKERGNPLFKKRRKKHTQLRTDAKISQNSKSQFKILGACQKVTCRKSHTEDAQISGTHLSTHICALLRFGMTHSVGWRSAAARLLGTRVRVPLRAWVFVSCIMLWVVWVAPSATSRSFVQRSPTGCVCVLATSEGTGQDPTSAVRPQKDSQVTVTADLSATGVYIRVLMRKNLFGICWQCSQRNSHNFYVEGKLNDQT